MITLMKYSISSDMIFFTTPFRERIKAVLRDEEYASGFSVRERKNAQENADKTFREAREIIRFKKF